jgi:maleylacetoacetate isomerase
VEYHGLNLRAGEQRQAPHRALSPIGGVPVLVDNDSVSLTQSLAIIDYLDARYRQAPLLPGDPLLRARVLEVAQLIASDIHPLNNLRVLRYLKTDLGQDQDTVDRWYRHWIATGLAIVEQRLAATAGRFSFGDTPGLADCLLVPQVYNAQRFECPLDAFPTVLRVNDACLALPAFSATHPDACPDAA